MGIGGTGNNGHYFREQKQNFDGNTRTAAIIENREH